MRSSKLTGRSEAASRAGALLFVFLAAPLVAFACSKAPAEPVPASSSTSKAEPSAPSVSPLVWEVPGTWTVLGEGHSGNKKAAYKVPKAGNDKEEAEMAVFFYGTGSEGDVEKRFKEWFGEFDGNVGAEAKRESFEVRGLKVELVEAAGTYKIALGPKIGPKKKSPMQMVKQDWRLLGAAVKTPDRGNWFFKMAGPKETVEAARGTFRTMLESAR